LRFAIVYLLLEVTFRYTIGVVHSDKIVVVGDNVNGVVSGLCEEFRERQFQQTNDHRARSADTLLPIAPRPLGGGDALRRLALSDGNSRLAVELP
jgi:hypothetical protein